MSLPVESVTAAPHARRPELWAIGRYAQRGRSVDYPISYDDYAQDSEWTRGIVAEWAIERGHVVVLVYSGIEAPWFGPILDALNDRGAAVCQVDPAAYEAPRTEMMLRRFHARAVVGIGTELVDGFDRDGRLAEALAHVELVICRPDVYHRLSRLPCKVGVVAPVGPALALWCGGDAGIHVNDAEWTLTQDGGGLTVSSRRRRAHVVAAAPLPELGLVRAGEMCRCGRPLALRPAPLEVRAG